MINPSASVIVSSLLVTHRTLKGYTKRCICSIKYSVSIIEKCVSIVREELIKMEKFLIKKGILNKLQFNLFELTC